MFPNVNMGSDRGDSFPRVSGDVPKAWPEQTAKYMFSPRERGCSGAPYVFGGSNWVFPA